MHPARDLAYKYFLPYIQPGQRVLDLGCGDAPWPVMLNDLGCSVFAVDLRKDCIGKLPQRLGSPYLIPVCYDLSVMPWSDQRGEAYEIVTAIYSLQHFIGFECGVWQEIARVLKPGGLLLCCGRYNDNGAEIENDRQDPLRADNRFTIEGLAAACGLWLSEFATFTYTESEYTAVMGDDANAYCAVIEKPKYRPFLSTLTP